MAAVCAAAHALFDRQLKSEVVVEISSQQREVKWSDDTMGRWACINYIEEGKNNNLDYVMQSLIKLKQEPGRHLCMVVSDKPLPAVSAWFVGSNCEPESFRLCLLSRGYVQDVAVQLTKKNGPNFTPKLPDTFDILVPSIMMPIIPARWVESQPQNVG